MMGDAGVCDTENPGRSPLRSDYWTTSVGLSVIFVALMILKGYWLFHASGPHIFKDEIFYKENVQAFLNMRPFNHHYPPLYSLLLTPAFFLRNHWYESMIFINMLLSSAVIFPVYGIARCLVPRRLRFAPVIMTALLSFQAVYPPLIMSENAFVVIFLSAVYFSVIREERSWRAGNLAGIFLALAYMTRYLALPAIVFFFFLRPLVPLCGKETREGTYLKRTQLKDMLGVAMGYTVIFAPWLLYSHGRGAPVMDILGLSKYVRMVRNAVIGLPSDKGPTLSSLALWLTVYASYAILAIAPFLSILLCYLKVRWSEKREIPAKENVFMFTVGILSVGYFALAVQHSLGARYNYPRPQYIIGRYLMHLTPLYTIVAVVAIYRVGAATGRISNRLVAMICLGTAAAVFFSQKILFRQAIWRLPSWFASLNFNAPDAFIYKYSLLLYAVLLTIFMTGLCIAVSRRHNGAESRYLELSLIALLIVFQGSAFLCIFRTLPSGRDMRLLPRLIAPILVRDIRRGATQIDLFCDMPRMKPSWMMYSLQFWDVSPDKLHVSVPGNRPASIPRSEKHYVLSADRYSNAVPLLSYKVHNVKYYLYGGSRKSLTLPPQVIDNFGPKEIQRGKGFNVQPSGRSALWFIGRAFRWSTVVVLNNVELKTTVGNSHSLSATVPGYLFKRPGEYPIYLLDKTTNEKSNQVTLRVK